VSRRRALALLAVLLAFGFLAAAVARDWSAVEDFEWEIQAGWLLGGIALVMVNFAGVGLGYGLMVRRLMGPAAPGLWPLLRIWALSQLGRYVPGSVVMVVGRLELGREIGVPRKVSLAASAYEQALSLATAALAGLVWLVALSDGDLDGPLWLVALLPLGLALLHPRPFGALASRALSLVNREPLEVLLRPREVAVATLWFAACNIAIALGVWMLVRSAAGPEAGSAAFVGFAYLLSFTVALLAFVVPSGLGIRDGLLALALAERLPGGVAVAVAIGLRLVMTAIELLFAGLVVLAARRFRSGQPHYHGPRSDPPAGSDPLRP
jgi:hypothetical protein